MSPLGVCGCLSCWTVCCLLCLPQFDFIPESKHGRFSRFAVLECETNPRQICGYYQGMEMARTRCRKVNYSVCVCVGVRGDRPDLDFSKLCQLSMEERNNNAICWQNVHKNTQHSVKSAHLILLELQRGGKHSP